MRELSAAQAALRDAIGSVSTALREITWRAVLITQSLGVLFALTPWLEQWHGSHPPSLALNLLRESLAALIAMLAALTCDQAVRRGARVWPAFAVVVLCTSGMNAGLQVLLSVAFGKPAESGMVALQAFFGIGGVWGTVLLVYVNRQSARRLLARLRADELERANSERQLAASRLAAVEAQIDPAVVLGQLAHARDLYAAGRPDADVRLEELISHLREVVARGAAGSSREQRA